MSRVPSLLPRELGERFTVAEARAAGVSDRRLRARDIVAPFSGVRTVPFVPSAGDGLIDAAAEELRHRIAAYATRMPVHCFFTHFAALVIWCGLLTTPAPRLDVGVFAPARTPRVVGIHGHRVAPHLAHVTERDGLRLTTPASTWAMLAARLDVRDLVSIGSLLVTPPRGPGGVVVGAPLTALTALASATRAGRRLGVERLRAALPLIRSGARSRPEGHLLYELTIAGLPVPELDVELRDMSGALIGFGDLAYRAQRVYVEYQGEYHRLSRAAWAADMRKHERAREAGWTRVQLSAADLYPSPAPAVTRVRAALRAAGCDC